MDNKVAKHDCADSGVFVNVQRLVHKQMMNNNPKHSYTKTTLQYVSGNS